ncbi:MAG: hypothetical protein HYY13_13685 [Nitrospirae bacterium]|nr:hypothetical protein [Nitrospirota bacterium]
MRGRLHFRLGGARFAMGGVFLTLALAACGGEEKSGGAKSDEVRRFDEAAMKFLKKEVCEVAFVCAPEAPLVRIHGTPEECLRAFENVAVSEALEGNKTIAGECPNLATSLEAISRRAIEAYEQCVSDVDASPAASLCPYMEVTGSFYGPDDARVTEEFKLAANIPSCKLAAEIMRNGPEDPKCKAAFLGGAFAPQRPR